MSKKWFGLAASVVLAAGVLSACGNKDENAGAGSSPSTAPTAAASNQPSQGPEVTGTVTASGSTALQPLVQLAAQDFMAKNKGANIQVTGGGSGTGVKNVADGVSNIGNSDVEAAAEYKDKLVDHIVCIAPFALIVNNDVTIDSVTKQQAADIFSGKITNWKEVGGKDAKINLVHRPDSSGSRKLVQKIILDGKDFSKEGVTQDSSKTVAEAVTQGAGSIGYVDVPYITDKVKALKIDGVAYSKDTIKDGKYPLYGVEHMYTKGEATGATKAFLDFIMSKEFFEKPEVQKMGFLPADLVKK
ncbi:phosphate ABC transporter substrate-binding protein [Paenibacillus aurantius]|uniref:Phosphate-binding protein n=1 Tax=Paenibacillus aurantius TaxID=2918900 RepID=A0AA96RGC0_9BACL|nr:phosphate ABC transporter substrate-binding protein [Paenibacillus aurantius]WNQ09884.1 phosphate ABC transporter substrate-binding protein [Paenibacillus aurantius]